MHFHENFNETVLKGVIWVHKAKIRSILSGKHSIGYTMIKLGQMVLTEVNWVHNAKIKSYGLERS